MGASDQTMEVGVPTLASERREWQIFAFGSDSAEALAVVASDVASWLGAVAGDPADVAARLRLDLGEGEFRRAVVARTPAEAAEVLRGGNPELSLSDRVRAVLPEVVFLFPGGGSQRVNMGRELYRTEGVYRAEFDRLDAALRRETGVDLARLVFADGEEISETQERLQPCASFMPVMLACGFSLAKQWQAWGIRPAALIGHSLGEYCAATVAGVFAAETAVAMIRRRGELHDRQPKGAMLSVRLSETEIRRRLFGGLEVSVINSSELCGVSGTAEDIAELERRLALEGVVTRRLRVPGGMHSSMVEGAMAGIAELVAAARPSPPVIAYISNLSGRWITAEEATDPGYYSQQIRQPVRFADGLTRLFEHKEFAFLEVGPGQALTSLVRQHPLRTDSHLVTSSAYALKDNEAGSFPHAIARFWVAGFPLVPEAFGGGDAGRVGLVPREIAERARGRNLPVSATASGAEAASEQPVGETEKTVAALWGALLGREPVTHRRRDFFDLGGNSILGLLFLRRVREAWGMELPLPVLFSQPTVAGVARVIDEERARIQALGGGPPRGPGQRVPCLTPIQPSGSRLPLFVFPGGNGEDSELYVHAALSNLHYGPDQPVHAFRREGWDGTGLPRQTVSEFVRDGLVEMRQVQPVGPYCLLGDCAGGPVAHEAACQLVEAGEEVALLLLTDSRCPRPFELVRHAFEVGLKRLRRTKTVGLFFALAEILRADPVERGRLLREKWDRARRRLGGGAGGPVARERSAAPRGGVAREAEVNPTAGGRFQPRHAPVDEYFTPGGRFYWEATQRHRPRFFPGRIHLVASDERGSLPRVALWRGHARELKLEVVGGSHWLYLWHHGDRVAEIVKAATGTAKTRGSKT